VLRLLTMLPRASVRLIFAVPVALLPSAVLLHVNKQPTKLPVVLVKATFAAPPATTVKPPDVPAIESADIVAVRVVLWAVVRVMAPAGSVARPFVKVTVDG